MAAPELRLEVSLGLNTFRDQMRKLVNIAQSEFTAQLNVRFDRTILNRELDNLRRAIARRTYRVQIEGNWENIPKKIQNLREALKDLESASGSINILVGGAASIDKKEARKIRAALYAQIMGEGGKLKVPATIVPKITGPDINAFKKAIQGKLGTIEVKVKADVETGFAKGPLGVAGLAEYMRTQGASGEAFGTRAGQAEVARARENLAREAVLARLEKKSLTAGGYNKPGLERIITSLGGVPTGKREDLVAQAKALIKESRNVQDSVFAELRDLHMKLEPLRGAGAMPGSFFAPRGAGNYQDIISSIAGLTKNPRAAGLMLRQLPEERIRTNVLDIASRQATYYQNVPSARQMQKEIKGFDPVLKAISESFVSYTKSLNPTNPWIGQIGDGFKDVIRVAAQSATTKLLPAAGMTSANRMSRAMFEGLPPLQAPLFGRLSEQAGSSLDKARQLLGLPIGPVSTYTPNPWAGMATVPTRQRTGATGQLLLPPAREEIAPPTNIRTIAGAPSPANPGVLVGRALRTTLPEFKKLANSLSLLSTSTLLARKKIDQIGFQNLPTAITGLKGKAFDQALNAALAESRGMAPFAGQSRLLFPGQARLPAANIREVLQQMSGRGSYVMESPTSARLARLTQAASAVRGASMGADPAPGLGNIESLFRPPGGTGGIAGMLERLAATSASLPSARGGAPGVGGLDALYASIGRNNLSRSLLSGSMTPPSYVGAGNASNRLSQLAAAAAGLPAMGARPAPGTGLIGELEPPFRRQGMRGVAGGGAGGAGGGRGQGSMGESFQNFGRAVSGMRLPGRGLVLQLGNEFKFATQQVLLFGTAYKALAFLQSFPAQVGESVASLQSFNNTLKNITPTAQEAASSNEFILGMVERYNIPLESARAGFTKLYASMAPAGFSGEEIRDLFGGISKAAATFGMSADKVDRVTYAFAQMASKGQVMSEELKGQLGDVLPGALGIFAQAAGFTGTEGISKFSKALEDGAYKGKAMQVLLRNVTYQLNKEYGPGAEGAAKTFQGVMNRMSNSTRLFYESFEPVAVAFANQVVVPITQGVRDMADGMKAFFAGQKPATEEGARFAALLQEMAPTIKGIVDNIRQLGNGFAIAGQVIGGASKAILSLLSLPIVGYLASSYGSVMLLVGAFNLLGGQAIIAAIASASKFAMTLVGLATQSIAMSASFFGTASALQTLHSGLIASNVSLTAYQAAMARATVATQTFGTMVQTVMTRTVIGVALVAIGALIGKIVELRGQMEGIAGSAKGMQEAARMSAKLGDVAGTKNQIEDINARLKTFRNLQSDLAGLKTGQTGGSMFSDRGAINDTLLLSTATAEKLLSLGLIQKSALAESSAGYKILSSELARVKGLVGQNVLAFEKASAGSAKYIRAAQDVLAKQRKAQQGLLPIPPGEGDDKGKAKALEDARKLADDKRKYEGDLMKLSNQQAMELDNILFDHWKTLHQQKLDYEAAGQNEMMQQAVKFQKDLQAIEIRRMEAVRRARQESQKAEVEANAAAYVAQEKPLAMGGAVPSSGYVDKSVLRNYLISQGFGRTTGDFTNKGHATPNHMLNAMDMGILGGSDADALRKTIAMERKLRATGAFGSQLLGPESDPYGHGAGKGGQNIHLHIPTPRGKVKMTPGLADLMKGAGVSTGAAGLPPSRQGTEAKQDYAAAIQGQEAVNAKARESLLIQAAAIQAQKEANTLIKEYVASIAPVEQLKLENSLLATKTKLLASGVYGDALDNEMRMEDARLRTTIGIRAASAAIAENNRLVKEGKMDSGEAAKQNALQTKTINDLTAATESYIPLLRQRLGLEQQQAETALRGEIGRASQYGGMGLAAGFIGAAGTKYEEIINAGGSTGYAKNMAELTNQLTLLQTRNEGVKNSVLAIGDAFGTAMTTGVASMVNGTSTAKEVFSSFLKAIGESLLQAAAQMIATYTAIGIARMFAGLGGGGAGAKPDMSLNAVTQRAGIGSSFANGGIAPGGFVPFKAFAAGGVVNGPTLGLVGEGRYNEAIVPLPNGRSIPVELGGAAGDQIVSNITVNVNNGQAQSNATNSNSSELGRKIEGAVKQVIVGELRPGGLLSSRS